MENLLRMGIDIGSTTVKVVVIDESNSMLFSRYERHYSEILDTVKKLVTEAYDEIGERPISAMITGRHRKRNTGNGCCYRTRWRGRKNNIF